MPRVTEKLPLPAEPQKPRIAAHFHLWAEFIDAHSARALRTRHPHPPLRIATEIHHHMRHRRLANRPIGVLPKKQIATPQRSHQAARIRLRTLEFSPSPEKFVLIGTRAREHFAPVLTVEPANRIRAIHRPRLHLARRNPRARIANPLPGQPAGVGFQIRSGRKTLKKCRRQNQKAENFHARVIAKAPATCRKNPSH